MRPIVGLGDTETAGPLLGFMLSIAPEAEVFAVPAAMPPIPCSVARTTC